MMSRDKPAYKTAQDFCRAYLGSDCFAPFTGQDTSGWRAFVYLVEMFGRSDYSGRPAAIDAMRSVLSGIQNKEDIHQVFCQTIPAILDWSHVAEIWPNLKSNWKITAIIQVTEEHLRREEREDKRIRARQNKRTA